MTMHMQHPVLLAFCYISKWFSASPVSTGQGSIYSNSDASTGDLCLMTETKHSLNT